MGQIHNGILISHKKNNIMPFSATSMELETLILSKLSQKWKDKYHMTSHIWTKYSLKNTCSCMFIAALFTITKIWKQPKCPLTDDCIKEMWYTHTVKYFSTIKRTK